MQAPWVGAGPGGFWAWEPSQGAPQQRGRVLSVPNPSGPGRVEGCRLLPAPRTTATELCTTENNLREGQGALPNRHTEGFTGLISQ